MIGSCHRLSSAKIAFLFVFLFAFQLSTLSFQTMADEHRLVRFSQDPWPPYTFGEKGEPTGGLAVDITKAIFTKLQIPIEIRLYPWKRALRQMELGERDGIMMLTENSQRDRYIAFTDTIIDDKDLIWFAPKHFRKKWGHDFSWNDLQDLAPYLIGETAGFNYGEAYKKASATYHFRTFETTTDKQNFEMLALGRIDLFICNETAARNLFKEHRLLGQKVQPASKPFKSVKLKMGFSKKSPAVQLIPDVNKVIQQLKAEKVIQQIRQQAS